MPHAPQLPDCVGDQIFPHRSSRASGSAEDAFFEGSIDMWSAQCRLWSSVEYSAHLAGNAHLEVEAHLTLNMCERERARVEAIARRISDEHLARIGSKPSTPATDR